MFYVMLGGKLPFRGDRAHIKRQIRNADVKFTGHAWKAVSRDAKDFLSKILVGVLARVPSVQYCDRVCACDGQWLVVTRSRTQRTVCRASRCSSTGATSIPAAA